MSSSFTSQVTVATLPDAAASSRLSGRKLVVVRAVWVVIATVVLGLVVTAVPVRYEKVRTADPNIRDPEFRNLIESGVTPDAAAAYDVGTGVVVFLALYVGGVLLFLRGSDSREASFLSLTLILYAASFSGLSSAHRTAGAPLSQSLAGMVTTVQFFLQSSAGFMTPFWLPEGRFSSRWTAWFTAVQIALLAGLYFLVSFPQSHNLVNIAAISVVVLGVWSLGHRYRVANDSTRQQIKWGVIGIAVAASGFFVWESATLLLGDGARLMPRVILVLTQLLVKACFVAVPVCFAIAILRYGLWHVDLIINRSVVYGTVTVVMVVVFFAGAMVLQNVLGQDAPLAFAISTAGAGLLFNPARNQIQRVVDRRLYGFRFDLNELSRAQHTPRVRNPGLLSGRTIGNYRLLGVLGSGGMGEVYEGEAEGRKVAVKVMSQEAARTGHVKWFAREAQTLAAVNHPNIVRFHEAGESDGVHYIVLDFIQGRPLSDIIRERGRLPFDEIRPFLHDCASALDYAHGRGLVHRDIKPSNIMMRRKADGTMAEAVLMDFGIARASDARTRLTNTGAIGTISYMAPEQIIAAATVDRRADIYALGVTMYEILTGELPFRGEPAQVLFAHLQQRPTDPGQLVPGLPAAVTQSLMRALEKKPADRFQSAGEFAIALCGTESPTIR